MNYSLFISCPKGLDGLLSDELTSLGLKINKVSPMGVYGEATLAIIYHICLWSRIANRVQLILFSGNTDNEQGIHKLCEQFPWNTVFSVDKTLAIEFHGSSGKIRNTMYGAQLVKDGIVDHFRKQGGLRPTVDKKNPQVKIHAFLKHGELTVSLDLLGYSLHQRGYRKQAGAAPLKENVASALLMRSGWIQAANKRASFIDPFCGSGTLVIEAAMIAAQIAPGLLRDDQALQHWVKHQPSLWQKVKTLAKQQAKPIQNPIRGFDINKRMINLAKENAKLAGVEQFVEFQCQPLSKLFATV